MTKFDAWLDQVLATMPENARKAQVASRLGLVAFEPLPPSDEDAK